MLGVDIYFVTVTDDDIIYLYDTSDEKRGFYPTIVLNTDGINFEVIGISHDLKSIDDHKIQTIFNFDDKFIIDMKQHSKELAKDSLKLLF